MILEKFEIFADDVAELCTRCVCTIAFVVWKCVFIKLCWGLGWWLFLVGI